MVSDPDCMRLRAPAKINLSFRIKARRLDGFHEIETMIAPVSLYDQLSIEQLPAGRGIELTCDDPSLPTGHDNLVMKAARLFLDAAQSNAGIAIALQKRIPHGAGLGGGSSDAATTLLGLNQLLGAGLDEQRLAQIAAAIGSDVPFFIFESAAICRGRGELVEPVTSVRRMPLLLLKPEFGVATPWAYSRWQQSRELPGIDYAPQQFAGTTFVNDLERPVFEKHLFLAQMKTWLRAQPEVAAAILSGSGSTVLAALRDPLASDALAARAKTALDARLWTCACETIGPQ
jgi:4-diphosphocytidyl-2-C-methyl-D-erythritol kinase